MSSKSSNEKAATAIESVGYNSDSDVLEEGLLKEQNISEAEILHMKLAQPGKGEKGNILSRYSEEQVMQMGRNYALKHDLDADLFAHAAAVARSPESFSTMPFLLEEEKVSLYIETTRRWHIPSKLIQVVALASMAAAVQGMDESVINGALLFYPKYMGISEDNNRYGYDTYMVEGLVNGAPYLCSGVISCWMSDYCNRRLGRKGTIFWTCVISGVTCIWQAFTNTWYHLFIARFMLGFGIGIKSATVPAYAAECAPKHIRGALVMLWQFFTAVGIMFGYVACLAFYYVGDHGIGGGLNWRLMLGSACIPAIIVLFQIPFVPESPRWLMGKERHKESYESLRQMRLCKISAARDTFYQYVLLQEEASYEGISIWKRAIEMFTIRRNRNGAIGAFIVMFMQQFCGINAITYYTTTIFVNSGFSEAKALLASWGFGMINFLASIPTIYTIDTFGRRNLLLLTFPLMSLFLIWTGLGFLAEEGSKTKIGIVAVGVYIFDCIYAAGEGPVPFTYSAEAFPLYIRDIGMSFATSTCWTFNFIVALTWPKLVSSFGNIGAFMWYAGWNIVGFFLVLWFLPETKGLTLEELDEVFSVSNRKHAAYQTKNMLNNIQRVVLRRNIKPLPPLYEHQKRMIITSTEWNDKLVLSHIE